MQIVAAYPVQSCFQWGGVFHAGGNNKKNIKNIPPSPVAPLRVVLSLLMSIRPCDCYPNTRLGLWWCIHWRFLYLQCQDRQEISAGRGLLSIFFTLSWGGIFIMGVYITENIKNMAPLQYPHRIFYLNLDYFGNSRHLYLDINRSLNGIANFSKNRLETESVRLQVSSLCGRCDKLSIFRFISPL